MLDIALLRKQPELVAERLAKRAYTLDLDQFQHLESSRRSLQVQTEQLQSQRNALSKQIGQRKSKGEDTADLMAQVASIAASLDAMGKGSELAQEASVRGCRRFPIRRMTQYPRAAIAIKTLRFDVGGHQQVLNLKSKIM